MRALSQIVSDGSRIFALANDGTLWTTDSVSPLAWSQLPAFTGPKAAVWIGVANSTPPTSGLTRYLVAGDGTIWHLDWTVGSWVKDNSLPP